MESFKAFKPLETPPKIYAGGITPPKFYPSLYEWLNYKGISIIKYAIGSAGIYTIPEGYTFFLTNACVSSASYANSNSGMSAYIKIDNAYFLACTASTGVAPSTSSANQAFNLTIPLKINERSVISLVQSAACNYSYASIVGFLVKNSDLVSF